MSNEPEILTVDMLVADGWYWVGDSTESNADWELHYVEANDDYDEEDDSDSPFLMGESISLACDNVQKYHVLIGPIEEPTIKVPFQRMPSKAAEVLAATPLTKVVMEPNASAPPALQIVAKVPSLTKVN